MRRAVGSSQLAFIFVLAALDKTTVARKSAVADTCVATRQICAVGIGMTDSVIVLTFVDIVTRDTISVISDVAVTIKTADSI